MSQFAHAIIPFSSTAPGMNLGQMTGHASSLNTIDRLEAQVPVSEPTDRVRPLDCILVVVPQPCERLKVLGPNSLRDSTVFFIHIDHPYVCSLDT